MPIIEPLRPHLREVLRSLGRDILDELSPEQLAAFLARGLAGSVSPEKVGPFMADLARRAREQGWLEPLLREWVKRLHHWAASPESKAVIQERLQQAADSYRERDWFKRFTYRVAEKFGGVDLGQAAELLQAEVYRFTMDQLSDHSQVQQIVRDGLANIEARLRDDPTFLEDVRRFILETSETGTLTLLLQPVLASLREEGRREVDRPDSHFLEQAMAHFDRWMERLAKDEGLREEVNAWLRRHVATLIEQHHSLVGVLVEENLNRLSEEKLSELIQSKVGDDLNWIRLNGSFVGGLIGVALYLVFTLLQVLFRAPGAAV